MPRFFVAWAFVVGSAGCSFDADYSDGRFTCTDNVCPSGFTCVANECVGARKDAGTDADAVDARVAALTCVDPGIFAVLGGTMMGSTASRSSTISSMCGGFVMNGADAVYKVNAANGKQLLVTIAGSFAVSAYVIAPCSVSPATPTCLTNTAATPGNPISVTTSFAGDHYIIVDAQNAAASGDYTLTLGVN
ncbi:MAG: hypothetical protein HOV81_18965 [Kofleriaceae bacterium]|nr:hypothetical protein [Kofleriaceae bacterium]